MEILQNLKDLDWFEIFIGLVTIVLACQFLYKTFIEGIIHKFGWETKKMREKREDHELLIKTSQNLVALQEKHEKDEHYLEGCLTKFIDEARKENEELRSNMKQFSDNRIHDREQSRSYQSEYMVSLNKVLEAQEQRDNQIIALMCGTKELLGAEIDRRYAKYIGLKGIPENEVDEFDDIYTAYKGLNGNHGRETKYNYVKGHLAVIPVKTELVMNI